MNSPDSSWTYILGIYILCLHITIANAYTKGDAGDACFDEPITVRCVALKRVNGLDDVEWYVRRKNGQWIPAPFASCNKYLACGVKKPLLPNGITVLNISRGTLNLQVSAKNSTNGQTELKCQVHYSDNTANAYVQKINSTDFSVCIRTQKSKNVNLTGVLQTLFPWKEVKDMELYANRSYFAYCNPMRGCEKTVDNNHPAPFFSNRLQVTDGSLLLTQIKESDDGINIRVQAHIKSNNTKVKSRRDIDGNMESFHVYNLKILVTSCQEPKISEPKSVPPTTGTNNSSSPVPVLPPMQAESPTKNSASTTHGRLWAVVIAFLLNIVRKPA